MLSLFKRKSKPADDLSFPLGKRGELIAQVSYQEKGFKIIATNEINRHGKQAGEIDFIAVDASSIVFVEVKTRAQEVTKHGTGVDSVNYYKQLKILKAAKLFLVRNEEYRSLRPQIDVCVIIMDNLDREPKRVTIISNAVEDVY